MNNSWTKSEPYRQSIQMISIWFDLPGIVRVGGAKYKRRIASNNKLTEVEAPDFVGEVAVLLAADDEHVRVHFDGHVTVKRTRT